MARRAPTLLLLILASGPAFAASIAGIEPDATLRLDDGQTLKLAGIETPSAPFGTGFGNWPLARMAAAALVPIAGRSVAIEGEPETDRWGRIVAEARLDDGRFVEDLLLAQGLARVMTTPRHRERAAEMLALEAAARAKGLGIWAHRYYAVRPPDGLDHESRQFEIVEGKLGQPDRHGSTLRLPFENADAELTLDRMSLRLFAAQSIDPADWAGRRVRLHGWVRWAGHPVIDVTHPEQVELLDG